MKSWHCCVGWCWQWREPAPPDWRSGTLPNFTLQATDGQSYTLADFKGRQGGGDRLVSQGHQRLHPWNAGHWPKTGT